MRLGPAIVLVGLTSLITTSSVSAQVDVADESGIDIAEIEVDGHPEVVITVVTSGSFTTELLAEDAFTVREAGAIMTVKVEPIPSEEVQVLVVLDTSGSMVGERWTAARSSAIEFVETLPADVAVGVVGFGTEVDVAASFGTDRTATSAAISSLRIGGDTALYDAVAVATSLFTVREHRYIVLLSDGEDTASQSTLLEAVNSVEESGSITYAVSLSTDDSANQVLLELAPDHVLEANTPDGLSEIYVELADQLANQYTITYTSRSGGPTTIAVTVVANGRSATNTRLVTLPGLQVEVLDSTPDNPAADPSVMRAFLVVPGQRPIATVNGQRGVPRPGSTTTRELRTTTRPEAVIAAPAGGLASAWAFSAGIATVAMGVLLLTTVLLTAKPTVRPNVREIVTRPAGQSRLKGLFVFLASLSERLLKSISRGSSLNELLERSGSQMRLGEFVIAVAGGAAVATLVGLVLGGIVAAVMLAVVTVIGARSYLAVRAKRRLQAFGDQLGPTLQLMATSLRTGHGLLQTVIAVAIESDSPTREEFHRVISENRLGRDLIESMEAMAQRMDNDDFDWAVQAISIQREVGGDLAEILENVAATIADRNRIRRQVDALSADGRISAVVLLALPFAAGLMFSFIQPGYLDSLFRQTSGQVMLASAAILMVVGALWLRKLVDIKF